MGLDITLITPVRTVTSRSCYQLREILEGTEGVLKPKNLGQLLKNCSDTGTSQEEQYGDINYDNSSFFALVNEGHYIVYEISE